MLGIKFIKIQPTHYLIEYRNGKIKREGKGLAFFYFAPLTSLVSVPIASIEVPFIIKETTSDFQEISIQGQLTFKISDPQKAAQMMNFSLDATGKNYASDDPNKLHMRIINQVAVLSRIELLKTPLKEAIVMSDILVDTILNKLQSMLSISSLGVEILGLSITAIKPTPEISKALETELRENLLKEADLAVYARRNAAVEQERSIKDNELNTELAVEQKKKEIQEAQMDAEMAVQEKKQSMKLAEILSSIHHEEQRKQFIDLNVENTKALADAKSYELASLIRPLIEVDNNILQTLALCNMDSSKMIAHAFRDLSKNAEKIGQLNLSPDLLTTIINHKEYQNG